MGATTSPQAGGSTGRIEVRSWTEAEFLGARSEWNALLARSAADPLFMSWVWASTWWRHHRSLGTGVELNLLAAYDGGELVGLAPLYLHRATVRRPIAARRLELVGNAWRDARAAFSEYLDVIAVRGQETGVAAAFELQLQQDARWHECVLAYVPGSGVSAAFAQGALAAGARVRAVDPLDGRRIALPTTFEAYLAQLSSDTRRKLYNHRRRSESLRIEYASAEDVPAYLEDLHRLRATRWGEQGGSDVLRVFQKDVALEFAASGALRLSRLTVDGRVLSVLFDLRAGDCEYYLQSGFDASAAQGLSPGYLHLGYAIEQAIADGQKSFDLLGGGGLNRDYKSDLQATNVPMTCIQIVRAPWLRALHWAYEQFGGGRAAA
jgi:CelD/BcsL family acetyltransferase involved in cellulose biosynthesis